MRLNPGERSLLVSFASSTKAQEVVNALKKAGFQDVQLDRVGRFGTRFDDRYNNPLASQANTVTGLTLYGEDIHPAVKTDTRALLAAEPSVSGVGLCNYGVAGNEGFLVTVVAPEDRAEEAIKIVEKYGGKV